MRHTPFLVLRVRTVEVEVSRTTRRPDRVWLATWTPCSAPDFWPGTAQDRSSVPFLLHSKTRDGVPEVTAA